ncbi:MAG: DegV family protein [Chloroflexi bacterium]|nr:DegV family protein [Chloroflexota bacterium]
MTSSRIRIAADSVCDLPVDLADRLKVHIIPTYVNIGRESIPDDGESLDRERFYRELPAMQTAPTTAAPSPGDAEAFYRAILAEGVDHIVSIHVPEKLSGTLNAMRLGAEAVGSDRVTLVDSLQLTFGIGIQVWGAAELAAQSADLATLLDAIERMRQRTRVYAIIDTMEYLRRSGRVNSLAASIGGLLKIKPIVSVNEGEVVPVSRQRAWSRAVERLRALTLEQKPLERLAILHIANRSGAEKFLESIHDSAPSDTLIIETTPTLGAHIGPGSIGVATLKADWRR